jgi:hypothetical protein
VRLVTLDFQVDEIVSAAGGGRQAETAGQSETLLEEVKARYRRHAATYALTYADVC